MSATDGPGPHGPTPALLRDPTAPSTTHRTAPASGRTSSTAHRTSALLADGREIHYYDAEPGRVPPPDPRELPDVSTASQMRFDPVLEEWVVMASHRQTRTFLPPADQCPLCPSTPQRATEVPARSYDVAVFENRFPSLSTDAVLDGGPAPAGAPALPRPEHPDRAATGRCEVVCFTSDHDASFADLSPAQARLVIDTWADRTTELSTLPGVEQVFCFENRGEEIGVTLGHPHGQIYAYPFLTPRTRQMLDSARRYRARHGRSLFADVVAREQVAGTRVVVETEHWLAFVPAAARWPVEVHLYPRRAALELADLTGPERDDLAVVYLDLLRRLDGLYGTSLPYIAAWHQAPVRVDRELGHLHLELFSIRRSADKLKYLAGSESAMGAFVTDVLPEDVAARLRAVRVPTPTGAGSRAVGASTDSRDDGGST